MRRLATRAFQSYWRVSRGLTLGAQGLVVDARGHVLLIRHTYRPGWHFPGGGVERNELVDVALARELEEEAGVRVLEPPELFGLYANFQAFPSDHVLLFVIRAYERPKIPAPNREIAEQGFFPRTQLPSDTVGPVLRRLSEVFDGERRTPHW